MIKYHSKYRSTQNEIMDDFALKGEELNILLTDLQRVNEQLGGNRITLTGIKKLLCKQSKSKTFKIVDIGCGDGHLLRECAKFGKKHGYNLQLVGVDANENIIAEAKKRSQKFENIRYAQVDVFSAEFDDFECDIVLCTLFLHHFENDTVVAILKRISENAKLGVVVNDLQRSRMAFFLFRLYSLFFISTKIAKHDGLVSIARAFKKKELNLLLAQLKNVTYKITWKWAFRYQWILTRTDV